MFKHILIPTDGSKLSAKGARAGVKLAKALGAKVTALHVSLPYIPPVYGEAAMYYVPGVSSQEMEKAAAQAARKALDKVQAEAKAAGVRCTTRHVTGAQPWRAILRAARSGGCDAIVMASHGRGGMAGLILGSETTKVLANSKLPVVVVR